MTTLMLVLGVWFSLLAAYVMLRARQPKLVYPKPPKPAAHPRFRSYAA